MSERPPRNPGTTLPAPPLVRIGELRVGQVVRPCAGHEPRTVERLEPAAGDPHGITVVLRDAAGERRGALGDRRMWIHGDWPGGIDSILGFNLWLADAPGSMPARGRGGRS